MIWGSNQKDKFLSITPDFLNKIIKMLSIDAERTLDNIQHQLNKFLIKLGKAENFLNLIKTIQNHLQHLN